MCLPKKDSSILETDEIDEDELLDQVSDIDKFNEIKQRIYTQNSNSKKSSSVHSKYSKDSS